MLLDEIDAHPAINAGRTIFHYLDRKVNAWQRKQMEAAQAPAVSLADDDIPF